MIGPTGEPGTLIPMHTRFALLGIVLAAVGCSLFNGADNSINNGVQQGAATHLTVITLLQSPAVPGLDGGPAAVGTSVFFGNRPTETTPEPVPVDGAKVTVSDAEGLSVSAPEQGTDAGLYVVRSIGGGLRYDQNALYTFNIVDNMGTTYTAQGTAPAREHVAQLEANFTDDGGVPLPVFAQAPVSQPFTLSRSAQPTNGQLDVAFVAVFSIQSGTPSAQPTWTNAPQTPVEFLTLITNDAQWRTTSVQIPGSAFPTAGFYVVSLTAVNRGSATSNDLFLGSAILLGTGTAGVVDIR